MVLSEFFCDMEPPRATAQERQVTIRNGKPAFYEPSKVKEARQKLTQYIGQYAPPEKNYGPVRLTVVWYFGTKCKRAQNRYKDTKPDIDNMMKMLLDVMTVLGFWDDDRQVVGLLTEKRWSLRPGVLIRLESVDQ